MREARRLRGTVRVKSKAPVIPHHGKADDFGQSLEIAKWILHQGSAQNRANLYAKRFRVTSIGSTEHWDRIGQFFAAFASGQTTASVALKRLVGHGPKNRFYRATRELGRVFKTEFILDYLSQPARFARGSDAGSSRENSYTPSPGASTTADWADWITATSNAKPARRAACFSSSQLSSIGRFGRSIVF